MASAIKVATEILDEESTDQLKAKVIFIVTDSVSMNPFETYYRSILAKEKNYYVFVMVVGGVSPLQEMRKIASEESKVQSKTFDMLVTTDVTEDICLGMDWIIICDFYLWLKRSDSFADMFF